jgi:putative hemolysin
MHSLAWILLAASLAVLLCTVAAETALAALGSARRAQLIERGGLSGQRLERLLSRPDALLGTIVVASSLALFVAAAMAAQIAARLLPAGPGSAVLSIAFVALVAVMSEVVIRAVASRHAERTAVVTAWPMVMLVAVLSPIVWLVSTLAHALSRGGEPFAARRDVVTKEDIETLITAGAKEGTIERDEKRLLHSIFDLSETTVKEVMTPRNDVVGLPVDATYDEIMKTVVENGYSRLPVYEDTIDSIIGIVYVKDLLAMWDHRELIILHDLMREPVFVPEAKRIDDLIREFQKSRTHMGVVVDEYGGVSGVVTMEDLLEEIVGEIQDEYDEELVPVEELGSGVLRVTGRAGVRKINAEYETEFPEDAYATMGGYAQSLFARVPRVGDAIETSGWRIAVEEMDGRRIARLMLTPLASATREEEKVRSS